MHPSPWHWRGALRKMHPSPPNGGRAPFELSRPPRARRRGLRQSGGVSRRRVTLTLPLSLSEGEGTESALFEHALAVELHQGLRPRAEGGAAPWHGGGLDRLEQLALGRPMIDGPSHVRDYALLPAAVGEDDDVDHLAGLDGELHALAVGERGGRLAPLYGT